MIIYETILYRKETENVKMPISCGLLVLDKQEGYLTESLKALSHSMFINDFNKPKIKMNIYKYYYEYTCIRKEIDESKYNIDLKKQLTALEATIISLSILYDYQTISIIKIIKEKLLEFKHVYCIFYKDYCKITKNILIPIYSSFSLKETLKTYFEFGKNLGFKNITMVRLKRESLNEQIKNI